MKILMITNLFPNKENIENVPTTKALYNLVKNWDEEITIIRPSFLPADLIKMIKLKEKPFKLNKIIVQPFHIWKVPKTTQYFYKPLIRFVEKNKINVDVIIAHRLHCAIGAAKLANKINKPLIIGLHKADILHLKKGNLHNYYRKLFKQAVYIACRSKSLQDEINIIYPEFTDKYFTAFSGIEKKIINSIDKITLKHQEWKQHNRPIRFVTASRLIKLKNIDINLIALSKLDKSLNWDYTIIGDGPEMMHLKKLAQSLKISDKVNFVGKKNHSEVLNYLDKSDVFIMVSSPETFGLAYLEAMAKGCIVIGAFKNGIDGVVYDGINGFLCKPKDTEDLAFKITKVMNLNYSDLSKILISSNETIKNYTEEKASNQYLEKIHKIMGRKDESII